MRAMTPLLTPPLHAPAIQLPRSIDLSMHDFLEFRVRSGDGHTYVASVRTDNYTGGDEEVWQAPLRPSRCGGVGGRRALPGLICVALYELTPSQLQRRLEELQGQLDHPEGRALLPQALGCAASLDPEPSTPC